MVRFIAIISTLNLLLVSGNVFLGRNPEQLPSEQMSLEVQRALLHDLEGLLGSEHKSFTQRRLNKIQDALRPIFTALPKNQFGKLGTAAASYALHRLFVQRHGWSVKGLQSETKALSAWNESSPTDLFPTHKVDGNVTNAFSERLAEGLGLQELAVLAATLEHLVHQEAMARLHAAYAAHSTTPDDVVTSGEAEEIMDSYMSLYILGFMLNKDVATASPKEVNQLRSLVPSIYPTWNDTQEFMREVHKSVAPKRDYLYYADVATVIEEAGERYGTWQDKECRVMKDELTAVEDTGPGGAGRVRLADFYKLAVDQGKGQFSESIQYLRKQGALDESDASNPRVIITNYISSPSNCVASSSYFSVCCVDECESLFQKLERSIAAPDASPTQLIAEISALASHTAPAGRVLSNWLQQRLHDIAQRHGGRVPLHGRLFTQWMHFAYPRECSYPHAAGTMEGERPEDMFSLQSVSLGESAATQEQMLQHIETYSNRTSEQVGTDFDESAMWSMDEELVVWRANEPAASSKGPSIVRGIVFMAVIAIALTSLKQRLQFDLQSSECKNTHKFYV